MLKVLIIIVSILSILMTEYSYAQQETSNQSIDIGALWESKYVFHGRNVLGNEGIYWLETTFQKSGVALSFWYGNGDASDFEELDTSLAYAFEVADFLSYLGYSRYEYISDNEYENEVSAGVAYTKFSWLTPAIDYAYSFEADGSFVEAFIHSDVILFNERMALSLYAMQAFDFGYETEEHDGLNNFAVGAEATIPLTNHLEINGFIAYSIAQEDVKLDGQGNLSWGGIGIYMIF